VAEFEPVLMVANQGEGALARSMCGEGIEVVELPVNDAWSRDCGPIFLSDGKGGVRASLFRFNSWGEKFLPYDDDAKFGARVCELLGIPTYQAPMVLEGGGISTDGQGSLLTTEQCLLNKNRNPNMTRADVEDVLCRWLGVEKVIWLGRGTARERSITDGHVDGLCVFVAPGVAMLHVTADSSGPHFEVWSDARSRLEATTDARGRKLEVIELPRAKGLSHINFYVANGGVVVPIAGRPEVDDRPLGIIREAFPGRRVVGVSGLVIAAGGGGVHCITQQIPKHGKAGSSAVSQGSTNMT
jgi:agmatine deiminase